MVCSTSSQRLSNPSKLYHTRLFTNHPSSNLRFDCSTLPLSSGYISQSVSLKVYIYLLITRSYKTNQYPFIWSLPLSSSSFFPFNLYLTSLKLVESRRWKILLRTLLYAGALQAWGFSILTVVLTCESTNSTSLHRGYPLRLV